MEDEIKPGIQSMIDEAKAAEPTDKEGKSEETKVDESTTQQPEAGEKAGEPEAKKEEPKKEGTPYEGQKFKHIKTVEELEESYANSFKEANRLLEEKAELERKIEELKTAEGKPEGAAAPEELAEIKAKLDRYERRDRAEQKKQYDAFISEHPELETDVVLQQKMEEALGYVGAQADKEDKHLDLYDGMKRAWKIVAAEMDLVEKSKEEAELQGAEKAVGVELAANSAPSAGAPGASKKPAVLTEAQKRVARTYKMTDEQYLEYIKK